MSLHPTTSPARRTRPRGRVVAAGVLGIAVVALLAAGCSASPGSGSGSDTGPASGAGPGTASAVGPWGRDAPRTPRLELAEDGGFTGTDGCNRLFGSWTQDERTVEFSGIGSTRMSCLDVDTWLEQLHSARVDGDTLHISDADGVEIGTLGRPG